MVKPVLVVAIEDVGAWPKGVPGLDGYRVVAEPAESMDADESPREWWKKLFSPKPATGVVDAPGESFPNPLPKPNPGRPKGIGADRTSSSSKSTQIQLK